MRVTVDVVGNGQVKPPAGTPVVVQIRDTMWQDERASVLGEATGSVTTASGPLLAQVQVEVVSKRGEPTIWAHVDVDRDGRVSRGDYVTVQSYPLPASPGARIQVLVKRV